MTRIDEIYTTLEKYMQAMAYAEEHRQTQDALAYGRAIRSLDAELAHERGLVA
jgi:hypothetical protein